MFHMIGKSTFMSIDDSNAFKIKMQELTDELLQKQFDVRLLWLELREVFLICLFYQIIEEEVGGNKVDG